MKCLLLVCLGMLLLGCQQERPKEQIPKKENPLASEGIVLGEIAGRRRNVENGNAYDKAGLELGKVRVVIIPETAEIQRDAAPATIELFMKKSLGFYGHPPERMSIRLARNNMGCACKLEKDKLFLATYGEWDSRIEGGARISLVVKVPKGVRIETSKGLSGPESQGQEWHGAYLTKPKDVKEGYWYGPASPGTGWKAIPSIVDTARAARAFQEKPATDEEEP